MKNLSYSSPATKKKARWQVKKKQIKANRKWRTSLFFIALPIAVYFVVTHPLVARSSLVLGLSETVERFVFSLKEKSAPSIAAANNKVRLAAKSSEFQAARDTLKKLEFVPTHIKDVRALEAQTVQSSPLKKSDLPAVIEVLPQEFASLNIARQEMLEDKFNRVSESFKIPSGMQSRVGFWFDIYTKYSSFYHVVHHADYPWLVFRVVDVSPIMIKPGNRWKKYHKAQAFVKNQVLQIRTELRNLSKRPNIQEPNMLQAYLIEVLKDVPGKRSKVYADAARNTRVQLGQKDFFKQGLINSSKYISQMEEIFAHYDLPVELTRLPLVESSFNEKAVSKVGASGIWQFMPNIGAKFLKVSQTIDERNSPIKSTEAAAKLLMQNYRILKSWPFALTAYNHGPAGVMKAAKAVGSNDISVIVQKYSSARFGFASSNFYASFLAALHAERYQDEIFGDIPRSAPHKSETLLLVRNISAKDLARTAGITLEELRLYNPDLKSRVLLGSTRLPSGYRVFLPVGAKARYEMMRLQAANSGATNSQKLRPKRASMGQSKKNSRRY